MSDDSMRAKARATFGKEFMDQMKVQPLAKNGAVALQKRANARPIPTYKDGGKIEDARISARMAAGNYKKGGKLTKKADGGVMDQYSGMPAPLQQPAAAAPAYDDGTYGAGPKPMQQMVANPNMPAPAYKKGGKVMKKDGLAVMIAIGKPMKGMKKPVKKSNGGTAATAAKPAPSALMKSLNPQDYQKAQAARAAAATPAAKAAARAKATANVARDAALKTSMAQNAQQAAVRKQRSDAAAAAYKNTFMGKQREINAMKAANATKTAQNNQTRAANATQRAALQATIQANAVKLGQQKAANDAAMAARDARMAAKTPVKKAVGGAGKTRKGMMKGK
jgi:hypothetical protein